MTRSFFSLTSTASGQSASNINVPPPRSRLRGSGNPRVDSLPRMRVESCDVVTALQLDRHCGIEAPTGGHLWLYRSARYHVPSRAHNRLSPILRYPVLCRRGTPCIFPPLVECSFGARWPDHYGPLQRSMPVEAVWTIFTASHSLSSVAPLAAVNYDGIAPGVPPFGSNCGRAPALLWSPFIAS